MRLGNGENATVTSRRVFFELMVLEASRAVCKRESTGARSDPALK
jgi:hypothetical protein